MGFDRRRLCVLVVDPYTDGGDSLALVLKLEGHEVRVACRGAAAAEAARLFPPDVAIFEAALADFDGFELARRLRTPGARFPLLIMLTGWGQRSIRERARRAGIDYFALKGGDPRQILDIVSSVASDATDPPRMSRMAHGEAGRRGAILEGTTCSC